jgi:hypothetical protein
MAHVPARRGCCGPGSRVSALLDAARVDSRPIDTLHGTSSHGETWTRTGDTTISGVVAGDPRAGKACKSASLRSRRADPMPADRRRSCRFGLRPAREVLISVGSGAGRQWLVDRAAGNAVPGSRLVAAVPHLGVQVDVTRPLDSAVLGIDPDLLEELSSLMDRGEDATRGEEPSLSRKRIDRQAASRGQRLEASSPRLVAMELRPFSHES